MVCTDEHVTSCIKFYYQAKEKKTVSDQTPAIVLLSFLVTGKTTPKNMYECIMNTKALCKIIQNLPVHVRASSKASPLAKQMSKPQHLKVKCIY